MKDDLVVDFAPLSGIPDSMSEHKGPGGKATKELVLDIVLAPKAMAGHGEVDTEKTANGVH